MPHLRGNRVIPEPDHSWLIGTAARFSKNYTPPKLRPHMFYAPARRADRFIWNNGNGTAEASTLFLGGPVRWEKLYNDEEVYNYVADVGLILHNYATGKSAHYYLDERVTREGETTHWVLRPCPETLLDNPALAGTTLTVFND